MAFKTTEPYTLGSVSTNEPPKVSTSNPDLNEYKKYIDDRIKQLYQQMQNRNDIESQTFKAKTEEEKRKYLEDIATKDAEKLAMNIVSGNEELKKSYLSAFTNQFSGDNARAKKLMEEMAVVGNNLKRDNVKSKSKIVSSKGKFISTGSPATNKEESKNVSETKITKLFGFGSIERAFKRPEKQANIVVPAEAKLNSDQEGLLLTSLEKYNEIYSQTKKDFIPLTISVVVAFSYIALLVIAGVTIGKSLVETLLAIFSSIGGAYLFTALTCNLAKVIKVEDEIAFYKRVLQEFGIEKPTNQKPIDAAQGLQEEPESRLGK